MSYGYIVSVNIIYATTLSIPLDQMRDNLMSIKIEVDPIVTGPAFRTAQRITIEIPRLGERMNRERQMKWI
jgi:hypothetical protein